MHEGIKYRINIGNGGKNILPEVEMIPILKSMDIHPVEIMIYSGEHGSNYMHIVLDKKQNYDLSFIGLCIAHARSITDQEYKRSTNVEIFKLFDAESQSEVWETAYSPDEENLFVDNMNAILLDFKHNRLLKEINAKQTGLF